MKYRRRNSLLHGHPSAVIAAMSSKLLVWLAVLGALMVANAQEIALLPDLSAYGYPYSLNMSEGWYLHPPSVINARPNATFTAMFGGDSGNYTTVESCAEKCAQENASAGGWSSQANSCYCYYELDEACLEPCVALEGIEFSTVPYDASLYCEQSFCDSDYFYNNFTDFCENDVMFDAAACNAKLAIIQQANDVPDLSGYGYNFVMDSMEGWFFQPPDVNQTFTQYEGVLSAASCASRCQAEGAPAGAWNYQYNICWCHFNLDTQCLEPCVGETGFEFSTQPFSPDLYCEKSFCDVDYFYNDAQEYCDNDVMFDAVACNAKLATLQADVPRLSVYGYNYLLDSAEGWYFQPPDVNQTFTEYANVLSAASCASRCQNEGAPAGAWNDEYYGCFCYFNLATHCLEPCVAESGFEFSTRPFSADQFCEKSFCDEDYFYNVAQDYCDRFRMFDAAECDAKLEILQADVPDLSGYGYDFVLDSTEGWLFQPPGAPEESFSEYSGVLSAVSCAEKCQSEGAPAGAWNDEAYLCWCYSNLDVQCLEPCVAESGFEFSTRPFSSDLYCEKSFCDEDYFYDVAQAYCDSDVMFDAAACAAKLEILQADEPDLSGYGYNFVLNSMDGWLFQPPDVAQTMTEFSGVLSAASCANKCQGEGAPAGAWNDRIYICWCYFNLETHCLEPCVAESGVEFSTQAFSADQYCEKSFCDVEYFYNDTPAYCDVEKMFDAAACDAKIAELDAPKAWNFTAYGYPFMLEKTFLFQPPPAGNNFLVYDFFLQESSCAQKCREENAPAGAWNYMTNTCWCYFALDTQCLEPCIEETGVVFSSQRLVDYCEKSFCDSEYFFDEWQDYCQDPRFQFDEVVCDAKIAAMTLAPSSSPTTMAPTLVPTSMPTSVPTTLPASGALDMDGKMFAGIAFYACVLVMMITGI